MTYPHKLSYTYTCREGMNSHLMDFREGQFQGESIKSVLHNHYFKQSFFFYPKYTITKIFEIVHILLNILYS